MNKREPRVLMVDSATGNDYVVSLCTGLHEAGTDITLAVTQDRVIRNPVAFPIERWAPAKTPGARLGKLLEYGRYLFRILSQALSGRVDIVHYQFLRRERLESIYLAILRLFGVHIVYTCHNVLPHECGPIDRVLRRLLFKSARIIIAHSEYIKRMLVNEFGLQADKIRVIPHGDFDTYLPTRRISQIQARDELGLDSDDEVLLFFGYIREYKGLDILLDAFELAVKERPYLRLVIAGAPDTKAMQMWCADRAGDLVRNSRVLFHSSFIPPENVGRYFTASDAVVLPYRCIYHSGVVHLAYSFSRPVIATRVGDFEETIKDGHTGFLVEQNSPEDLARTLVSAMSNRKQLAAMGREAKRMSDREFSWNPIARRTQTAYASLAGTTAEAET